MKERNRKIEELVELATLLPEAGDEEIVTIDLRDYTLSNLRQEQQPVQQE